MSFVPNRTTGARRTTDIYGYERGTLLWVHTKQDGFVEGYILQNPAKSGLRSAMELGCVYQLDENGKRMLYLDTLRLSVDDIIETTVRQMPQKNPNKPKPKMQTEKVSRTVMVETSKMFRNLLNVLNDDVTEVGLNFYGVYVGRDGKVGWICLYLPGTLVCIDVVTLEAKEKDFWRKLNETLFSNESIKKVMYNSRPVVDYIYHKFNFPMMKVFDIQVADFFFWSTDKKKEELQRSKESLEYSPLSRLLETFVNEDALPEEIELLKWFEKQDFTKKSPLLHRPINDPTGKLRKCIALEMKYLLVLKKIFEEKSRVLLDKCMAAHMESMCLGNNYIMEMQLVKPLAVPCKVVETFVDPFGIFVNGHVEQPDSSSSPKSVETVIYQAKGRGRGNRNRKS